jgi:hypothetical protein
VRGLSKRFHWKKSVGEVLTEHVKTKIPLPFKQNFKCYFVFSGGLFTFGAQPTAVSAVTSSTAKSLFSFTGGTNPTVPSVNTQLPSGSGKNTPFSFTPSNTPTTLPNATTTDPVLPKANSIVPFNFSGSLPSAKTTVSSNQSNPAPFSFTGATSTDQSKPASLFNFGAVNGPTSSNGPNVVTAPTGTGLFSFTGSQVRVSTV